MRVVFDTNILVSAFILSGSQADLALTRVIEGLDRLLISKPIIDELLGALARKFAKDADELAQTAVFLTDLAALVEPRHEIHALADEADNRILECAIAGAADAIVTGDAQMLKLRSYESVSILSLRAYLDRD